ncbi:hypothetical protein ACO11K_001554 [Bacillus cytotoxicus]
MSPVFLRLFEVTKNPGICEICLIIQDTLRRYDSLSKEEIEKRIIQLKVASEAF